MIWPPHFLHAFLCIFDPPSVPLEQLDFLKKSSVWFFQTKMVHSQTWRGHTPTNHWCGNVVCLKQDGFLEKKHDFVKQR